MLLGKFIEQIRFAIFCFKCFIIGQSFIKFPNRLFLIDPEITLKSFDDGLSRSCHGRGEFCLPRSRRPFNQERSAQLHRKVARCSVPAHRIRQQTKPIVRWRNEGSGLLSRSLSSPRVNLANRVPDPDPVNAPHVDARNPIF